MKDENTLYLEGNTFIAEEASLQSVGETDLYCNNCHFYHDPFACEKANDIIPCIAACRKGERDIIWKLSKIKS